MPRKKSEDEPCGNWMDTYGDMVTLLLTFFVLLYSMANLDQEKFAKFARAFTSMTPDTVNIVLNQDGEYDNEMEYAKNRSDQSQTENETLLANVTLEEMQDMQPDNFDELYEYLKAYVEKGQMQGSVEVTREGDGCVFIRFRDNLFFSPDSAILLAKSNPLLDFLGNCLKNVEDEIMTININGHTADPKIDNYRISDWLLSSERAARVAQYFEDEKDILPSIILPIGYGKNFPIASNDTEEGREKNRRVDMLIVSKDSNLTADQVLSSILDGDLDVDGSTNTGGVADVLVPENGSDTTKKNDTTPPADVKVESPYSTAQ